MKADQWGQGLKSLSARLVEMAQRLIALIELSGPEFNSHMLVHNHL